MKRVVCFDIPEPLAMRHKTHNKFLKYRMKWKLVSDSFFHMWNLQKKHKKKTVLSIFIVNSMRKTRQRRGFTHDVIDELWRLRLSKWFHVLCHRLIYELAIFHSTNRDTYDKVKYQTLDFKFATELFGCKYYGQPF